MNKKLAIKGHPTRGNEVIELLKMMGGVNSKNLDGKCSVFYFFIDNETSIGCASNFNNNNFVYFTLEKFWEKYPFKVGDKVIDEADGCPGVVCEMKWDEDVSDMKYCVAFGNGVDFGWFANDSIKFCKESENLGETPVRDREDVLFDSIIWHLRNSVNNGKQHLSGGDCETYFRELVKKVKMYKPAYPKTTEECYEVLEVPTEERYVEVDNPVFLNKLIISFTELLIARNAYWKIAGEQMKLGKPWDSTYGCGEWGYWIGYSINENKIYLQDSRILVNHTLVFPTAEMRDAFYENFKDLIEQCKELL